MRNEIKHEIEEITADNRRDGMPEIGYIVRSGFSPSCGWTIQETFKTFEEAVAFANKITNKE
jgi:hypothetical protein